MAGLYLHIPFCKQACYYCDFHFSTGSSQIPDLLQAMQTEFSLQREYLSGEAIHTIYLGGGTPSILKTEEISSLFSHLHKYYEVDHDAEITLEGNPDDLSLEKLKDLKSIGINRLSVGIQSFDDSLLKFLNRAHDSGGAEKCLNDIHSAGFKNFTLDLIYAIPELSHELWKDTLKKAASFEPQHISSYALTIEDRTVFGDRKKKGKLKMVDEEVEAIQFEMLSEYLVNAGYEHYEISNFAKPGFISKHNSAYWKGIPYLGIGPSAHSYNGISRQFNIRNNSSYIRSLQEGKVPFDLEILSPENKINEYILTSLRTSWGCDLNFLKQNLHDDILTRCGIYINKAISEGLLIHDDRFLKLTQKGKLLADKIAADLMVQS